MKKRVPIGIVGVSGYGGRELLRYLARHPNFELAYACANENAGKMIGAILPGIPEPYAGRVIETWSSKRAADTELIFVSLPTGQSAGIVRGISDCVRVVDLGGDHRFAEGWTYGLPDIYPNEIKGKTRVANPGCYPTAAILALAPLLKSGIVELDITIFAVSGLSGMGRGSGQMSAFADMNEDTAAYGFFNHPHLPELHQALRAMTPKHETPSVTFVPQYVPMTRGLSVVCVAKGFDDDNVLCVAKAREFYKNSPFVRVMNTPPHTKYATGSNLAFISYVGSMEVIITLAAIDNLGKGAAGNAVQNANLMFGLDETAGLDIVPVSL